MILSLSPGYLKAETHQPVVVATSTPGATPKCADLTGNYTLGTLTIQGVVVWDFKQIGCQALAMGSHLLRFDGTTADELEPRVLFASAEHLSMCETPSCYILTPIENGFEYYSTGMLDVSPTQTCVYDHAKFQLNGHNLIRTFYLNDPDPACTKLGQITVTYHRMP